MRIGGVDEAGRGPVIGPLVIVAVVISEDMLSDLRSIGVRDSKQLTPEQRERIFDEIVNVLDDYSVVVVSPQEIDNRSSSLNLLEVEKFALALNSLNVKPSRIYVDSADVDEKRFASLIRAKLNYNAEVIAEHKADAKYEVVAAASILAKVIRDREIEKLKERYGDFGSGYPSDPRTRRWLEEYYKEYGEFPPIVRRSWDTVKRIEAKFGKSQLTLDRFL
ncbi:ribonuclease HII [Pyrococcus sp. NA2]|uniref:ribonuclease HII n=1 Tax=Pyrococcus sp. (strain NA2) TaxID=342949 RepID=UPI000209AFBB|nr:ribonuclease HII [Pyrococcus sp. NA2]AEC51156.1 ribonuclease HII [Pyrococcus sp. NA2]